MATKYNFVSTLQKLELYHICVKTKTKKFGFTFFRESTFKELLLPKKNLNINL